MKPAFHLLGPVEAVSESGPLDLGGPKQRALLAALLLRANEVVPREHLIDQLWGDAPPATARETVKVYVGRLRKVLDQNGVPAQLVTRNGGYMLQIAPEQLDLHQFERLAERGSQALAHTDAATAANVLSEALALWRGTPLSDISETPFAPAEQARLEELRLTTVENRTEADLALGHSSALVAELRKLVRDHPYRERLHRQLMLALYRSGRQAEALAAYQDARAMFIEQLGIEPSNDLRDLERAILRQDPALVAPRDAEHAARFDAPPPRGSHHPRRPVAVGVALVVAAGAGIAAILLRTSPAVHVRPHSVAVIDPASNELVADIAVGRAPAHLVTAYKRVWVANTADRTVTELDPKSRTVLRTIPLETRPLALGTGSGKVWLVAGAQTNGSPLELAWIDPRFGLVSDRRVDVGTASQGMPREPLAFARATIWAPGRVPGTIVRRDPRTLAARGAVELDAEPFAIAADSSAIWVTTVDNRLLRIDPVTNTVIEDQPTGGRPLDVTVGAEAVWIVSWSDDVVTRYDPVSRSTISIPVGDGPTAISFGFGSVWVACSGDGTVWRIDPATRKVVAHWTLGASPEDITAGDGAVWVAAYSELPP